MPQQPFLSPLRLIGAQVLRDGVLEHDCLTLAAGYLVDGPAPEVDLSGFLALPGIVDLHGASFAQRTAGRQSAPLPLALAALDREAAGQGITTGWIAQGWSWEGGACGPDAAETLLAALAGHRPRALTDLRVKLCAETHLVEAEARLVAAIRTHGLDYVTFSDRLDLAWHKSRSNPVAFGRWAAWLRLQPDELLARMEAARGAIRAVPRHLCRLAAAFNAAGVRYGSHGDMDGETRAFYASLGAVITELPQGRSAAASAHAVGTPVVLAAAGLLPGAAPAMVRDLIADGLCDALVSDGCLPALPQAAFALADQGLLPLGRAWGLLSTGPARIMGLADRGALAPGMRADLVLVNATTREIEATISGGRLSYLSGEAARRFLARPAALQLAAE